MRNTISWGYASLRERGLIRTASSAVNYIDNWLFDLRFGTNTAPVIETESLDIPLADKIFAHEYRATKVTWIHHLMRTVDLPEKKVFIDFGCGKGKALLIASNYGCQKLIGVEYSPTLCTIARANLQKYLSKRPEVDVEVIECNAAQFEFSDDENVIYFFNPFATQIIVSVLTSLENSLRRSPRPIWILYAICEFREPFDQCDFLELQSEQVFGGCEHLIYRNKHYKK